MFGHRTIGPGLASLVLTSLFLLFFPDSGSACRMYGAIGDDLPDGMLFDQLRGDPTNYPNALYYLSPANDDGWGIAHYLDYGGSPSIARGEPMAQSDPAFTATVQTINASEPRITLAHIRKGTSGCFNVPDPHPFYRDKNGKRWLFMHNGGVSKVRMTTLLGDYLIANPPNGSNIPACESGVVDSELYFLFLLKKIEEMGWNVVNGATEAINEMIEANESGAINFILSDGETIWAFRRGTSSHTLYHLYDAANGYSAVTSQYPSAAQGNWIAMANYQLIVLTRNAAPAVIDDVRSYCPGDLNNDGQVDGMDLAALTEDFGGGGIGDLDFDGDMDGADLAAMATRYWSVCP